MESLHPQASLSTCPICSKNLNVVKKRSRVTADGVTYCCQACADFDARHAKAGHRHTVTRSPFAQRIR